MNAWERYGELEGAPDSAARERMERGLEQRLHAVAAGGARRSAAPWLAAAIVVVAAAALVVWLARAPQDPARDATRVLTMHAGAEAQEIALPHDGRLIVAVHTRIELVASDDLGATIDLLAGEVALSVHRHGTARWIVRVDGYVVEAIGTRFRVVATGATPEVIVDEGVVEMRGPGLPGKGVRIGAATQELAVAATVADEPADPTPVEGSTQPRIDDAHERATPPPSKAARAGARTSWLDAFRTAIDGGDTRAAVAALPATFPDDAGSVTASDYVDAGDAIAATGDPVRADRSYRAACRVAARSSTCGVATLRRAVARARANEPAEAIELADAYLRDHPDGTLAREALGRRMQWRSQLGRADEARADAKRYLARWPDGAHAGFARRLLEP
jgi:hypothetical protein